MSGQLSKVSGTVERRGEQRVLLLEFLTTDRFCQYRSEMFPFVQGLCKAHGIELRWLAFGFEPRQLPTSPLLMALGERDTDVLLEVLREFQPTHVLSNEAFDEPLGSRLREAVNGAKLDVVTAIADTWPEIWFLRDIVRWLDWELPASNGALVVDTVEPDYRSELMNPLAHTIDPFTQVMAGTPCVYAPALAKNPYFSSIDLSDASRHTGCSFCTGGDTAYFEGRLSPLEAALKQVRAARRSVPPERSHGQYAIVGVHVVLQIRQFFEAILQDDMPPSDFFFWSRIDELNSRADQVDELLPRLARAGHSLNFWNVGVENFSAEENLRFNKGVKPKQIEQFVANVERWERDYPDTFKFREWGGFGFILFTPWTGVSDLRTNLAMAERCEVKRNSIFFMSRLQLFDKLPIKLLAERDGLVSDQFDDPIFAEFCAFVAVVSADQAEIPWRFREPVLAAVYGIFVRLNKPWKRRLFDGDEAYRRVSDFLSYRLPREHRNVYRFLDVVLDIAESHPEIRTPDEILDQVEARLPVAPVIAQPDGDDEDDDDGPDPHSDVRTVLEAGMARLLERLEGHRERPLLGWRAELVSGRRRRLGWGRLEITLARGDDRLRLFVTPAAPGQRSYVATRHYAFSYASDTPIDRDDKRQVVEVLAQTFEAQTVKALARRRGNG